MDTNLDQSILDIEINTSGIDILRFECCHRDNDDVLRISTPHVPCKVLGVENLTVLKDVLTTNMKAAAAIYPYVDKTLMPSIVKFHNSHKDPLSTQVMLSNSKYFVAVKYFTGATCCKHPITHPHKEIIANLSWIPESGGVVSAYVLRRWTSKF